MLKESYQGQDITFVWGEFATKAAAISLLAEELKPLSSQTKTVREALTTLMLSLEKGTVDFGPFILSWRKVENDNLPSKEIVYRFD